MNKTSSLMMSRPEPLAASQSQLARAMKPVGGTLLLALLTLLLSPWQGRATGFVESFEPYAQGSIDSSFFGGPNQADNGGTNPWFGSASPNFVAITNENGVFPHSGTNMIRGHCYNCLYKNDVDWFNLSFRCATGGVYMGNIALEWWFYDPLGDAAAGSGYAEFVALCNYAYVPATSDYDALGWPLYADPGQRMSLGAYLGTGTDSTKYQARIVGATEGLDLGWFNLNVERSVGWHHARIVIGAPNDVNTPASFYLDDMKTPVLTHATVNNNGFNLVEINGDMGNTTGYFDDLAFQDNVVAPAIATGPTNVTVLAGGSAVFRVSGVSGTPAPLYIWQKDGAPLSNGGRISGPNTATLTISGTVAGDQGSYSCLVSNIAGVAIATATLTIIVPPTIDSQSPAGGTFAAGAGGTVTLSVTAHASNPINYLWKKNNGTLSNGGHVSGVTLASLTLTGIDASDAGTYSCHLSNADGAADSVAVVLSLASGPTIVTQPAPQSVALGSNATFTVTAAGSSLAYQWMKGSTALSNGGRISGATSSALGISSVIDADAVSYSCIITNLGGSTNTASVGLTVVHAPVITTQPASVVATIGGTVPFHVVATGTSPSYQWKKNGTALSNAGDFSGVTTPDLSVHVSSLADVANYTVTVSNLAGSVTSSVAALRVNQTPASFVEGFESYPYSQNYIGYARYYGTAIDQNNHDFPTSPWWGQAPPNFCAFASGQDGVTAHGGSQMAGSAFGYVSGTSGDNDESFYNLAFRLNGGQIYYGNIMLDWYFSDPGTPDAGDQFSLANFGTGVPGNVDSSTYLIPGSPSQNLFIGTWPSGDTTKYQVGMMGTTGGVSGRISANISGTSQYFDTAVARTTDWHHARIVVGPADPGTHVANVAYFIDDMSNAAFGRDLPAGHVGFNALHMLGATIFTGASETGGFFDDVSFQAVNDPYIVQQPVSVTTNYGDSATFTVVAMATSYQWQKNGHDISGANSATLTLKAVSSLDEGAYKCVVSGANGSLTSSEATLTVNGSPPFLTATLVGQKVVIMWTGAYPLLSATNATGPYTVVTGASSPYTNSPPLGSRRFFGLAQ